GAAQGRNLPNSGVIPGSFDALFGKLCWHDADGRVRLPLTSQAPNKTRKAAPYLPAPEKEAEGRCGAAIQATDA
uniref:hypothetical protein n=1 Tax=Pseudoglutamicibacter cumminsii TaxID=156979 RepID=UPI0026ED2DFB